MSVQLPLIDLYIIKWVTSGRTGGETTRVRAMGRRSLEIYTDVYRNLEFYRCGAGCNVQVCGLKANQMKKLLKYQYIQSFWGLYNVSRSVNGTEGLARLVPLKYTL